MEANIFKTHLEKDLIPFWNRLKDDTYGGFYGYVEGDGTIDKKGDKGVILNSRILWFYSAAYLQLKDPLLLEMANHAFSFLIKNCIDYRYGGVYWSVSYDGIAKDDTKHSYNQAFAIYALATYYEASGDRIALNQAYELFRIIEEKCRDEIGYLEAFCRDFTPAENDKLSENGVIAQRTMNTLLHILEAYTQLYKVDHFYRVGNCLRDILEFFKKKIYNQDKKMCEVFFDNTYHPLIDLDSYGHDIETSWLIARACEVLDDVAYTEEMLPVVTGIAEGVYEHAIDHTIPAMNNECEAGVTDTKKVWWVQAEAVIGFYNMYELDSSKSEYRQLSEQIWEFIRDYVIDKESGEWIENIYDVDKIDKSQALVHPWKCPYHNGRMCMEMSSRLTRTESNK